MWIQKTASGIIRLGYAPDGRTLYVIDRVGWVTAWDVVARTKKRLFQLDDRSRYYRDKPFVVGGQYLIVTGSGGTRVWDVNAPLPNTPQMLDIHAPRPAPSGSALLFIGKDRKGLDTYDLVTGQRTRAFHAPAGLGTLSHFSTAPDGSVIMIGGEHRTALIRADGSVVPIKTPYVSVLRTVRFSPDGSLLVWLLQRGVHIWAASNLAVRVGFAACRPESVFAFNPVVPVFAALDGDGVLTLFSLETGRLIRALDFGLGKAVQCVAFSPDGLTCAVGGTNKQFAVFDLDL